MVVFISEDCKSNVFNKPVHVYVMESGFYVKGIKETKQIIQETYIQTRKGNLFMIEKW